MNFAYSIKAVTQNEMNYRNIQTIKKNLRTKLLYIFTLTGAHL